MYNNDLDIILVTETRFFQRNVPFAKIVNYDIFNVDRARSDNNNNACGGTAIYIKRGFNANFIKIPNQNFVETTLIFWTSLLFKNFTL